MVRPQTDHTGEVYNNRRITGPGSFHRTPSGKGYWAWNWVCLNCGETGCSRSIATIKGYKHICHGKEREGRNRFDASPVSRQTHVRTEELRWLCAKQCRGCRHHDSYMAACLYILNEGKPRPKVDLHTESCPVWEQAKDSKKPVLPVASED